jgi:putative oxidoreductase
MDAGLLMARVVVGALMAAHGSQKLFGWFRGYGVAGTGGFFEKLGFRPGQVFAALAGLAESGGGTLFALGLCEPVAAALVLSVMIVAAGSVHWGNGLLATSNGLELPLLYGGVVIAVTLTGSGAYSLDTALGLGALWTPALKAGVLAAGLTGGLANLLIRRPASQPARAQERA